MHTCDAVGAYDPEDFASQYSDCVVFVDLEKPECTGNLVLQLFFLLGTIIRVEIDTLFDLQLAHASRMLFKVLEVLYLSCFDGCLRLIKGDLKKFLGFILRFAHRRLTVLLNNGELGWRAAEHQFQLNRAGISVRGVFVCAAQHTCNPTPMCMVFFS